MSLPTNFSLAPWANEKPLLSNTMMYKSFFVQVVDMRRVQPCFREGENLETFFPHLKNAQGQITNELSRRKTRAVQVLCRRLGEGEAPPSSASNTRKRKRCQYGSDGQLSREREAVSLSFEQRHDLPYCPTSIGTSGRGCAADAAQEETSRFAVQYRSRESKAMQRLRPRISGSNA
mmetsp:Transcript_59269/g.139906  ORF Transcript_59269/g.139906 Transcript_59269/m.139906 type:complete len:176 (+) Transcript_59269:398-925(+)